MTDSNPCFFVSNGTKLVLVEKLDRLARDLMVQETIIGDLRKNGFDLISVMEPDLLQDDPSRKLMRSSSAAHGSGRAPSRGAAKAGSRSGTSRVKMMCSRV